ncbi:penicillin-binding protein 2 [Desulfobacterales bacterium HSG16]|nr:penicillin-binding protein 2 [Desulfobacterales bacterium HSG16]
MELLKVIDREWFKQRLTGVVLCVMIAFAVLSARLFYLQVVEGSHFRRLSQYNSIRIHDIAPLRGLIYDRNGSLMAENRPSFNLSIIPRDAAPLEKTIEKLSVYIDVPKEDLMALVYKKKSKRLSFRPVLLKPDISRNALAAIEAHRFELPGVVVAIKPIRHYLQHEYAAHLLGYLGEINLKELKSGRYPECKSGDLVGKFGLEKACEPLLRGKMGGKQVEVNARGQVVRVLNTVDSITGVNINLTIDNKLQKKAVELLKGFAGAVAVLDTSNGGILALVSSPSFDPNSFVSGLTHAQWRELDSNPQMPMQNKSVQGLYPPASTYKIVTAIAGLEKGAIDEHTVFHCSGSHKFGNRVYRCWKRTGHGKVNVVAALAQSCDVFFYQVGQKLGVDILAEYARACGLGSATGINLDNEPQGLIPTALWKKRRVGIPWQRGETLSVAIGQGYNLVTPLQMAVLVSAVGNRGTLYRPRIIKNIISADGTVIDGNNNSVDNITHKAIIEEFAKFGQIEIIGKLPGSSRTLELVRKGLWEVVNGRRGTARTVKIKGIEVSGKTGTAQVFSRKKNTPSDRRDKKRQPMHLRDHAWFVAYAPSDAPRIAVSVIVEHGEHGSSTAAPIAREMIKCYLGEEIAASAVNGP